MPIIEDLEQRTDEWLHMRAGMVTASRVADVLAKLKRKEGMAQARHDYLLEVAIGRLTGLNPETYVSPAMQWGIENEPLARGAYQIATDREVQEIGFAIHPRIKWFGSSPDGLVDEDGCLEVKCPNANTHLEYILADQVPLEYAPQMLAHMACTERKWCDFASYHPRLPKNLQLFVKRFERDDKLIAGMELEVEQFLSEVEELLGRLKEYGVKADSDALAR